MDCCIVLETDVHAVLLFVFPPVTNDCPDNFVLDFLVFPCYCADDYVAIPALGAFFLTPPYPKQISTEALLLLFICAGP